MKSDIAFELKKNEIVEKDEMSDTIDKSILVTECDSIMDVEEFKEVVEYFFNYNRE